MMKTSAGRAEAGRRVEAPRPTEWGKATDMAVAYIQSNLGARITLKDLEAQTGLNTFQIIRAFNRDLGMTPHAFLVNLRLQRGVELLIKGEPTAEVASEVGFVDQSHFAKHFKRRFGTSPRRFLTERFPLQASA